MERHLDPGAAAPAPTEGSDAEAAPDSDATAADRVTITLSPQPRYIRVARLVAAGLANELGFGVDRLDDVRLAVGEACGLVVQAGAEQVALVYELDTRSLSVTIDAALGEAADRPAADYVALVKQVLTVACTDHALDRDDRRISIRCTFADGT